MHIEVTHSLVDYEDVPVSTLPSPLSSLLFHTTYKANPFAGDPTYSTSLLQRHPLSSLSIRFVLSASILVLSNVAAPSWGVTPLQTYATLSALTDINPKISSYFVRRSNGTGRPDRSVRRDALVPDERSMSQERGAVAGRHGSAVNGRSSNCDLGRAASASGALSADVAPHSVHHRPFTLSRPSSLAFL